MFELILAELAEDLRERGGIDLREALIDGTLAPANRGRRRMGKTKRGKGGKIMRWQTLLVFLSPCT